MLEIGKKAPDFNLLNQDGKKIKLSDYKGKWIVLYFYPKDDTPGCTKEACAFTTNLKLFEKLNAKILGVSKDSIESHKKFIKKHDLKIDLLSDEEKKVIEKYGAWVEKNMYGKKYMGVQRSTYLINPASKISFFWNKINVLNHVKEVEEKLKELKEMK